MKILVVDDHPVYRDGLTALLPQLFAGAKVVQAADAHGAFDELQRAPDCDLVLLDLSIPGLGGLQALQQLRSRHPAVPVVMISATDDAASVRACIDAGASGYIPKSARREILAAALAVVADGGVYLPPVLRIAAAASAKVLTAREREVLDGVCAGESNKLIARRLGISEATVRAHLGSVFRALGVANRTQAALAARQPGSCGGPDDG